MDTADSDRDPVEELAEEFVERYRRGERPSLTEYTDRYPQQAERIRALFPALVVMEKVRPEPADASAPGPEAGAPGARPERLGDYRILREVGRGGMGVVYEAEQESLGRHVALKVLPSSALLDPRHLQRFKREARAVARLHHSNIVPVHGVGEQGGLHYYVMQFIPGQGLDQVLVELKRLRQARQPPTAAPAGGGAAEAVARSLLSGQFGAASSTGPEVSPTPAPPNEAGSGSRSGVHLPGQTEGAAISESGWPYWHSVARIGIQVAEALAYASSQGILHRDIKPSNLLLDTRGTVWVTDFGLAKADTDRDNVTHTGDIVGTLRYMAPERFQGQADVRSDLYALGLTLYELLTLRPAFDESDRHKLIAQVAHDSPPRPRQVNRDIPRDLETIVLKATARDPAARYQTAGEMAEDLQRFLDDRPIKARRLSAVHRGWRWCRRNRAVAGLVVGLSLVLLAGTAVSTWQAVRATLAERAALHERDRAEKNFNLARQAVDRYFTKVSENPSLRAVALETLRRDLLLQAKEFYEQFIREQPEEAGLHAELGICYGRLGNICATLLGETAAAEAHYAKAIAVFEGLSRSAPDNPEPRRRLAQAHRDLGGLFRETRRPEKAQPLLERAVATAQRLVRHHPDVAEYRHELALAYHALGDLWRHTNRPDSGRDAYRQAIALEEQLVRGHADESGKYRSTLATSAGGLAEVYRQTDLPKKSEAFSLRAVRLYEELAKEFPGEGNYQHNLAAQYHVLSTLFMDTGQPDKARAPLQRAVAISEELVRSHPDVLDYHVLLANSYSRMARFENGRGRPQAVLVWYGKAIEKLQRALVIEPRHSQARWVLNDLRIGRAVALAQTGDHAQAALCAEEMAGEEGLTPVDVYNVACVYSRCSEAAGKDTRLPPAGRTELREHYAGRAVETLRQAVARGFQNVVAIQTETDFIPLRQRADFKKLLQELEGRPAAAK